MKGSRRKFIQSVGIGGSALLGGCRGLSQSSVQQTGSENGQNNTQKATTRPVPDLSSFDFPDGFSRSGIEDLDTVQEKQRAFLPTLESHAQDAKILKHRGDGREGKTESAGPMNTGEETGLLEYVDHVHDKELYFNEGELKIYTRKGETTIEPTESELFYGGSGPSSFVDFVTLNFRWFLVQFLPLFEWANPETSRLRGHVVVKYDVTGLSESAVDNLQNPSGTMAVTADGGVLNVDVNHEYDYNNSQPTDSFDTKYSIKNQGDATVTTPDWVAK